MMSRSGKAVLSKDIDIEVHGITDPEALKKSLRKVAVVNEVGMAFGVLKMKVNGEEFDISLPRADSKPGDGHRGFDTGFEESVDEVAAFGRRDFTINAMGFDPETEELVDPFGGSADLAAGILRHPTDAFDESPVRVLRAVQFAARFEFDIAPETLARARSLRNEFNRIPIESVWGEFDKLFTKGRSISRGLQALYDLGWEGHFPELAAIRDIPQEPEWHPEGAVHVHSALSGDAAVRIADRDNLDDESRLLVVLAATVHDLGKADHTYLTDDGKITSTNHEVEGVKHVRAFLKSIGASAALRDKVCPIVREHMCTHSSDKIPSHAAVARMLRRLEGDNGRGPTIYDWARVVEADLSGRTLGDMKGKTEAWVEIAEKVKAKMKPILRGEHLVAAGLKPTPEFGVIIRESIEAQDNGEFTDLDGATEWLKRKIAASGTP
jgi:tRNA nucleotidyltransferase (CCA-adding enzyme)